MYKLLGMLMCCSMIMAKLELSSPDFKQGEPIKKMHSLDGKNVAPILSWTGIPQNTKSFALIVDDPDAPAGTWVHWVVFNIPVKVNRLAKGLGRKQLLPDGTKQGINSWQHVGYDGPQPPPGKVHHYYFKLYALDTELAIKPGITSKQLERAIKGHIVAQAELMGTYER